MAHVYQFTIQFNDGSGTYDGIADTDIKILDFDGYRRLKDRLLKEIDKSCDGTMICFAYLGEKL